MPVFGAYKSILDSVISAAQTECEVVDFEKDENLFDYDIQTKAVPISITFDDSDEFIRTHPLTETNVANMTPNIDGTYCSPMSTNPRNCRGRIGFNCEGGY